jgi:transcription factor E2F3
MFESSLGACAFNNKLPDTHPYCIISNFEEKLDVKLDDIATLGSHTDFAKCNASVKGPRTNRAQRNRKEVVFNAQQIHKIPDLNAPCPSERVLRKILPQDVDVS